MLQKCSRTNKFKLLPEELGRRVFGLGKTVLGWGCHAYCDSLMVRTHNDPHAMVCVYTSYVMTLQCKTYVKT